MFVIFNYLERLKYIINYFISLLSVSPVITFASGRLLPIA